MKKSNSALGELIKSIPKDILKKHFDRTTVWKHLNGERYPDAYSVETYCKLLGIPAETFYRAAPRPSPSVKRRGDGV